MIESLPYVLTHKHPFRPLGIIIPAKSHPGVIIAAVAARDPKRAEAFAKTHDIPNVSPSYQALIDDPSIDAIYNPLPNGLHYEWTQKALAGGKHVLLEKPSTSNAAEAASLFRIPSSSIQGRPAPVLLEAVHIRFHPAWQKYLSLIDPANIEKAHSTHHLPKGVFSNDDIRFQYDLAGGCLMDFGSYNIQCLRQVFGTEPEECLRAEPRSAPHDQRIDQAFSAAWRFPNGGIGSIESDLMFSGGWPFPWLTSKLPGLRSPSCSVTHREAPVVDEELPKDVAHTVVKTVTIWNMTFPSVWHRIDVVLEHTLKTVSTGQVTKTWTERSYIKEYAGKVGDASWSTYRHQLEEFMNKVRGRDGSGVWIEAEDSIKQMEVIDGAYRKAGLPPRPSRTL